MINHKDMRAFWKQILITQMVFVFFFSIDFGTASDLGQELEVYAYSPRWLSLLHMQKTLLGSYKSRIEKGSDYFINSNGYRDPLAELLSSINALQNGLVNSENKPYRCIFPARFHILQQDLKMNFKDAKCDELDKWKQKTASDEISVVYASQYVSNPASAMGHTFLKFSQNSREDYLNQALGYAASIDDNVGALSYIFKGLFGGFRGVWAENRYYEKVFEYTHMERRDLWEFVLNLSAKHRDLLVEHLWELKHSADIDYFFIDENCSFVLLAALQAIDPSMDLTSGFPVYVIPLETIKKMKSAGLVQRVNYRPSIRNKLLYKYDLLSHAQKSLVLQSIKKKELLTGDDYLVQETLLDYLTMKRQVAGGVLDSQSLSLEKQTLIARSKLGQKESHTPPAPPSPLESHNTYLASLGAGSSATTSSFATIGFRPAAHGYLDDDQGYLRNSEFGFLNTELKYGNNHISWSKFMLIEIGSMNSYMRLDPQLSWRFSSGFVEDKGISDDSNGAWQIFPRVGISWNISSWLDFSTLALVNWQPFVEQSGDHRLWTGALVESIWRIGPKVKIIESESYAYAVFGHAERQVLASNVSVRFSNIFPHIHFGVEVLMNHFFGGRREYWETTAQTLADF